MTKWKKTEFDKLTKIDIDNLFFHFHKTDNLVIKRKFPLTAETFAKISSKSLTDEYLAAFINRISMSDPENFNKFIFPWMAMNKYENSLDSLSKILFTKDNVDTVKDFLGNFKVNDDFIKFLFKVFFTSKNSELFIKVESELKKIVENIYEDYPIETNPVAMVEFSKYSTTFTKEIFELIFPLDKINSKNVIPIMKLGLGKKISYEWDHFKKIASKSVGECQPDADELSSLLKEVLLKNDDEMLKAFFPISDKMNFFYESEEFADEISNTLKNLDTATKISHFLELFDQFRKFNPNYLNINVVVSLCDKGLRGGNDLFQALCPADAPVLVDKKFLEWYAEKILKIETFDHSKKSQVLFVPRMKK